MNVDCIYVKPSAYEACFRALNMCLLIINDLGVSVNTVVFILTEQKFKG